MTAQKYTCWREYEGRRITDEFEIWAADPESAAEYFAADDYDNTGDDYLSGCEVTVRSSDGFVYGVMVEAHTRPQFSVRPS